MTQCILSGIGSPRLLRYHRLPAAPEGNTRLCPVDSRKLVFKGKNFLIGSGKLFHCRFDSEICDHARCLLYFELCLLRESEKGLLTFGGGHDHFALVFLCYYL